MKKYFDLLRIKHYVKNVLIFVPIFFGGMLFEQKLIWKYVTGFLVFCMTASSVYIVNDLRDCKHDIKHLDKRKRPIASGKISPKTAVGWAIGLFTLSLFVIYSCRINKTCLVWLIVYYILNLIYSFGGKNIPILDVMILASGFVIRILYGAGLAAIQVSGWLYLTIWAIALYMGLGKRRNEIYRQKGRETRAVLRFYSDTYLNDMMHMCLSIAVVFYSLWSANISNHSNVPEQMILTLPLIFAFVMRYEMQLENSDSSGDPVQVLLSDKILILLGGIYILFALAVIYFF